MPQIQYFRDFIFKDDLSIKFYGYHTYLIYHVVAACNMAKDLTKDITRDITYYFKRYLSLMYRNCPLIHYSGHGEWSESRDLLQQGVIHLRDCPR